MGIPPAQVAVALRTTGTLGKTHRLAAFDVALLVEFDAGLYIKGSGFARR